MRDIAWAYTIFNLLSRALLRDKRRDGESAWTGAPWFGKDGRVFKPRQYEARKLDAKLKQGERYYYYT